PPREWSPYMPAKTLGQLSEEAKEKGEVKIKGLKNRSSKDGNLQPPTFAKTVSNKPRNTGRHAAQKPDDSAQYSSGSLSAAQAQAAYAEQFTTHSKILRGVGRSLQTHTIAPASEEMQAPKAFFEPNQPKQLRKQAKIMLILGAINLFAIGFWCGSFIFPSKR